MGFLGQIIANKASGANKATKQAAQIEAQSADKAIEEQRRQYDLTRADQQPWLQAGQTALNNLQDPNAFTTSPGYQFRLNEGMKAGNNAFAARGGAFSGNSLKALADYNQGAATSEYGNWWNQQAGLAGVGQTSANTLANVGQNYAGAVGNLLQDSAGARASGIVAGAALKRNAINTGMQNDAQNFGYFFGNRNQMGGWGG
jgi:hypothetical protein